MKLLRYGPPGREKPGLADREGNIRDLSKVITQIDDAMLAPRNLARLARVKPETLPVVRGSPRLGVPYAGISKFVAVGLNYSLSIGPYWGSDIGGFYPNQELTGELYARWFQFAAFCGSFRSHGRT